jgi:hypothetical protein
VLALWHPANTSEDMYIHGPSTHKHLPGCSVLLVTVIEPSDDDDDDK